MRKLVLTALVATVGCTAGGSEPIRPEAVGTTAQALVDQPIDDGDRLKTPRVRWVSASNGPSGEGGPGDAGDAGGTQPPPPPPSIWKPLTNAATFWAGTALLLTDGTVMVPDLGSSNWWKLTPDAKGSYLDGTWTQLAPAPDGYQPLYYASAVLPDGRVIVEGGEYQALNPAWQTTGAIYDPTKDQWTSVAPPAGWQYIGDAQSTVLADGRFYLANCCTTDAAILNPKALTWTAFGTGKADINDEEGWTLLPNGNILTIDTNNLSDLMHSELFSPKTGTWTSAGDTGVLLPDQNAQGTGSWEMGPQVLRPDGTVLAVGATGHNAVYHVHSGRWTAAPDFPTIAGEAQQLDAADGPGVLLPNGHVLVAVSQGVFNIPLHIFEFDGSAFSEIGAPPNAPYDTSYQVTFLLLPSGEVMLTDQSNDIRIYSPKAKAPCEWAPRIDDGCGLGVLKPGGTYKLSGTQLHGLSQAVAYGDDAQAATNYPLVRITNRATGHVFYSRTHDHSTMGISSGLESSTSFDVPANQELGWSELAVVANGIPSEPIEVRVRAGR